MTGLQKIAVAIGAIAAAQGFVLIAEEKVMAGLLVFMVGMALISYGRYGAWWKKG